MLQHKSQCDIKEDKGLTDKNKFIQQQSARRVTS